MRDPICPRGSSDPFGEVHSRVGQLLLVDVYPESFDSGRKNEELARASL